MKKKKNFTSTLKNNNQELDVKPRIKISRTQIINHPPQGKHVAGTLLVEKAHVK